jgi:hypothetical protein
MLELENGDEYGVPFFFFSDEDLRVLQPGWEQWKSAADAAADQAAQREREDLYLQAQAQAYARDRQANRQIAQLELSLLATAAGVTDMWEVYMQPRRGVAGRPLSVVVPARDSRQAAAAAAAKYPNYVPGTARRLN